MTASFALVLLATGPLGVFGRLHPAIVHLPIGFLLAVVALEVWNLRRPAAERRPAPLLLVGLAAFAAVAAVATGWTLAGENTIRGELLTRHQVFALVTAAAAVLAALFRRRAESRPTPNSLAAYRALLTMAALSVGVAGHLGASLTHGPDFLFEPLRSGAGTPRGDATSAAEDTPTGATFANTIAPLLERRCTSCHGETRQKGRLALHTRESLLAGGEHGPVLVAGKPAESDLLRRVKLPRDDEDRMPPAPKSRLDDHEIAALEGWIAAGAPFEGSIPGLRAPAPPAESPGAANEESGAAAGAPQDGGNASAAPPARHSGATPARLGAPSIPAADPAALARLREQLVHVQPLEAGSAGLWVDFAAAASRLDDAAIAELLRSVRAQVVELSLARTALGPATFGVLPELTSLSRLDLRDTATTSAELPAVAKLRALASLGLAGTKLDDSAVATLVALPALRRVVLWNSGISSEGRDRLARERGDLLIESGERPAAAALEVEAEVRFGSDAPPPGAARTSLPAESATASLTPSNATCPVSGQPVNPAYLVVFEGKVIGFCCPNCPSKFWADPGAYRGK